MPTTAVAVDPIIWIMCSAVDMRHLYSAVAMQELECTTADMETKLELSVLVSL